MPLSRRCRTGEYRRHRARQIAYGRWQPWAEAAPVREHVRALRRAGASYQAIGRAANVSPMTVHRLLRGERDRVLSERIHAPEAQRLLAVTPAAVQDACPRRDVGGTRLRLRALIAIGHPAASLAAEAELTRRVVWDIVRGTAKTVSPDTHRAVAVVYDRLWDQPPEEVTTAQRRAAAAARSRAARNGWPPPMGLDDERLDDPRYRPRARWRPVHGRTAAPGNGLPSAAARQQARRRAEAEPL